MSNLNPGGLTRVLNYVKTWVTGLLSSKANSSHTHAKSEITDFPSFGTSTGTICEGNDSRLSGISNSDIDDIADDAGFSSGSLPASEDIFITGDIIPNTDNSVDVGASSKNIKMIYTKGITINGTQFLPSDIPTKTSDLTNDSGYITSSGSCNYANYSGYVQGDKSTGLYVESVKYGNALVTTNQSGFGAIFNAPTKNYRIGCATWPECTDTLVFYSVTNTNVSSSTNNPNQIMTWNANDGTLTSANIQATSGLYYNSYRIYVG